MSIKFRVFRTTNEPGLAAICNRCRRTASYLVAIEASKSGSINLCQPCLGTAYGLPSDLHSHPNSKDITAEWVPGVEGALDTLTHNFTVEHTGNVAEDDQEVIPG